MFSNSSLLVSFTGTAISLLFLIDGVTAKNLMGRSAAARVGMAVEATGDVAEFAAPEAIKPFPNIDYLEVAMTSSLGTQRATLPTNWILDSETT